MNELQKRFEEMQERLERTIRGQRDTIALYKENNNKLRSLLSWRKVEELPVYELDTDGICNELAIVKYNCGDSDNYAVATYEWINQNFYEVEKWLPIPKLGEN